ncbi:hypothetical protein GCM10028785_04780 [Hydrogenophaga soli]
MVKHTRGLGWVYGAPRFSADEEHAEFQYRLLIWLMLSGSVVTWLVLLGVVSGFNLLQGPHIGFMTGFATVSLVLWGVLRGRKHLFMPVAWVYQACALAEYVAAWAWVPQDELRVLWFMVNVPGVYIVLGQRVGALATGVSVLLLWWGNPFNPRPYTGPAMVTLSLALLYLAVFFHLYVDRSLSYYQRMRESNQRLRDLASHDHLTGVFNARAFEVQAERLIRLAQRQGGDCAMLFVDLDHFKRINDQHGHAAGDVVLRTVAQAVAAQLRQTDVLGRVGGEEFAILLPDTDLAGAQQVAETLRLGVLGLQPDIGGGVRLPVTASIGVAALRGADANLPLLRQQADEAMYQAKAGGRNRVVVSGGGLPTIGA